MLKFGLKRLHLMLFAALLGFTPCLASADVSITVAPPPIPEYDQPPCPGDGYLWSPGYWAYGDADYYWVPGVWIEPPQIGFLWTPGWWGWGGGGYLWHGGFWGPHIGFYGGINYGFGYFGNGFWGGHWDGGHFFYNSACWHVGVNIHNTYVNRTFVNEHNRVSFNGPGGIDRKATAEEERAAQEGHHEMTEAQRAHENDAIHDRGQKFSENKGNPTKTALVKPEHTALVKPEGENKGGENKEAEHKSTERHGGSSSHGTTKHGSSHSSSSHQSSGHTGSSHSSGGHPSGGHPSGNKSGNKSGDKKK